MRRVAPLPSWTAGALLAQVHLSSWTAGHSWHSYTTVVHTAGSTLGTVIPPLYIQQGTVWAQLYHSCTYSRVHTGQSYHRCTYSRVHNGQSYRPSCSFSQERRIPLRRVALFPQRRRDTSAQSCPLPMYTLLYVRYCCPMYTLRYVRYTASRTAPRGALQ